MVELWPGKNYQGPWTYCWQFGVDNLFLVHPYPYQPQIVAENYFIVSKGWMRRELERY